MLSPETFKKIGIFIKRHSNNNILTIDNITYQAKTDANYDNFFDNLSLATIKHILILDCRCRDHSYFEGYDELGKMIHHMFKYELIGIDDVIVRYNCSTYFCKD